MKCTWTPFNVFVQCNILDNRKNELKKIFPDVHFNCKCNNVHMCNCTYCVDDDDDDDDQEGSYIYIYI